MILKMVPFLPGRDWVKNGELEFVIHKKTKFSIKTGSKKINATNAIQVSNRGFKKQLYIIGQVFSYDLDNEMPRLSYQNFARRGHNHFLPFL